MLDRIQPWLATLLALRAYSPFAQGVDSAYASFRYQVWGRWPCSGPTYQFGSVEVYQATVQQMIDTETLPDISGMVYFDARLSQHYPTIEVRIADVCQHAEDAVLIAALIRGLVETEARNWQAGRSDPPARTEQLRLARWRASRSGLDDVLINPVTFRPDKAVAVTGLLVEHVRDALADAGDTLPGRRPARRGAPPRQRRGRPALGIPAPRPPRGRHHRRRNHHHQLIWVETAPGSGMRARR